MSGLTIEAVTKRFGATPVLRGVDLHVPTGSLTAILGPSGCGKTTLLRLVAGFDQPDDGTITLDGRVLHQGRMSLPPEARHIGYVAQEGALFPHLSVEANIVFGLPGRERRGSGRAGELLELVGLDAGYGRRYPHQLSGGQQQRVALARALAPDPAVILLDEPFSSLDAGLRQSTRRAVADALTAKGATTILVTHDQDEALSLADQVAVMRHGTLAQVADPVTLYRSPVDAETAAFVGEANFLPADADGGWAHGELGRCPVAAEHRGPVMLLVRPEQLVLHRCGGERAEATVVESTFFGHQVVVTLRLRSGAEVTARVPGHERPEAGAVVGVSVVGHVHVLPVTATP